MEDKLNFMPDDEAGNFVDFDFDELLQARQNWSNSLMARLYSESPKSALQIRNAIRFVWGTHSRVTVLPVDNGNFLIRFQDPLDMRWVLTGPWSIFGDLLILQQWNPAHDLAGTVLSSENFWVEKINLQPEHLNRVIPSRIASVIGPVLCIKPYSGIPFNNSPVMARVSVNIDESLIQDTWARKLNGGWATIYFNYLALLHNFCTLCCMIGHVQERCLNIFVNNLNPEHDPVIRYNFSGLTPDESEDNS
ncbi:protein of unknown function DUF4283 [Macleaya cordata]|uniref:DUF4283 domain-containing protein n=1 Tax=Macleaya cordata TaxID=56857 RepID=A0A200RAP9_MACCD|nr:protein of unknown function DUF4283 [Macleaya cordata]